MSCDVCTHREQITELHLYWPDLCDEHYDELLRHAAVEALRTVIPGDLQHAKPSSLRSSLQAWRPGNGGLYLYGPTGAGKSHDAAALCKTAWSHIRQAKNRIPSITFKNFTIMTDEIMRSFGNKSEYNMQWISADLVVLDEIGMLDAKDFAVRKLYAIIEHRLHHRLDTIITSNLDLSQLAEHLDSPQIASRISQMCSQVTYEGLPDRRIAQSPQLTADEKVGVPRASATTAGITPGLTPRNPKASPQAQARKKQE